MSAVRVVLVAALAACLAGCDRVAAPLVDVVPTGTSPPPDPQCRDENIPSCDSEEEPLQAYPRRDSAPRDLVACGAPGSQLCSESNGSVSQEPDADAGVDGEPAGDGCAGMPAEDVLRRLDGAVVLCQPIELAFDGGEHQLTGVTLNQVNLALRATRPTQLTLEDSLLRDVFVELRGPIALEVRNPRDLGSLDAVGVATAEGRPRLALALARGSKLHTGTTKERFAGDLVLDQVELDDAQLVADHIELQSVALVQGRIEASSLTAFDLRATAVTLALEQAVLSGFSLWEALFTSCDQLALLDGEVFWSTLVPCTGPPVRVYDTGIQSSRADGRFESDESKWSWVALGRSAPTEVTAYGGHLTGVNFCEHALGPALGDYALFTCAECDGWTEATPGPCLVDGTVEIDPTLSRCPLLPEIVRASCPPPAPPRNRPAPP